MALARERVQADPRSGKAPLCCGLLPPLSALGANILAIETCLRATALEPKSAAAFAELIGPLRTCDETGRPFHAGHVNRSESIEALKHAIELDPNDKMLSVQLGNLY